MNTTKQGRFSVSHSNYPSHGYRKQSYAGFYMFLVALVSAAAWIVSTIISLV